MSTEASDKIKVFALVGIGALTVVNTVMIMTKDDGGTVLQGNPTTQAVTSSPNNTATMNTNDPQKQALEMQEKLQDQINGTDKADNATPADKATSIKFAETKHGFGAVKVGEPVKHTFKFTNTGDKPLVVEDTKGSCSCTVPSKPDAPIPPGGTGEIVVEFKAKPNQTGNITQTATVITNTNPKINKLMITAEVSK